MIKVIGSHNTAVCYTGDLEPGAMQQIKAVCDREEFTGCKIRIMPDVHAGMGCTIVRGGEKQGQNQQLKIRLCIPYSICEDAVKNSI